MSSRVSRLFAFFLFFPLFAHATPIQLVERAESNVDVPSFLAEQLGSEMYLRHRFVLIDFERLWELCNTASDVNTIDDRQSIGIALFPDFSVELKIARITVNTRSCYVVLVAPNEASETNNHSNTHAFLDAWRAGGLTARIWAAGQLYHIEPVGDGPVHVVTQDNGDWWRENGRL